MGFDPERRVGAIVLTNGDAESSGVSDDAVYALFARLLDEGEKL
jgi:hypothetical protein